MSEPDSEAWTATMTSRERVRAVVELLDEPASIEEIRDRADVPRSTAEEELDRLVAGGVVDVVTDDGRERYQADPVHLLFDEIRRAIESHSHAELERELESMVAEEESLREDFDAASSEALLSRIPTAGVSADNERELRTAVATWRALESDIRLCRHALQLYEDVSELKEEPNSLDAGE